MSKSSLFDVFLRLRPSNSSNERFITIENDFSVEENSCTAADLSKAKAPRYIAIRPPADDRRKRSVERFEFTHVFDEDASQQDLFDRIGVMGLVGGILGKRNEREEDGITVGRDGLVATLGVTGSGKSHTILGSKTVPGLTQLSLSALFLATEGHRVEDPSNSEAGTEAFCSLCASDVSEAHILPAPAFIESVFGAEERSRMSRAQTPMMDSFSFLSLASAPPSRRHPIYPSTFAPIPTFAPGQLPQADTSAEYAVLISMFEVYNDRIFDLLSSVNRAVATGRNSSTAAHIARRRALLFKSTEASPDRKVVAGLRKVLCFTLEDALTVLDIGIQERKVTGTGSNAVSSRSHGFFSIELKKREKSARGTGEWVGTSLTIVDLAGSERARQAKTAGATLAEAGKINESLMYLGRCMQMQSDPDNKTIVPFRQCKLTELLFSNSFPTQSQSHSHHHQSAVSNFAQPHRNPQKAVMIVAADARGDYNATYQILRYSALARDVTVQRVPSVNNTIPLVPASSSNGRFSKAYGRSSPSLGTPGAERPTPDSASSTTLNLLHERIDQLTQQLEKEAARREAAEETVEALSERLDLLEEEIRDEMAEEMEERVEAERRRWMGAWDEEADRREEWMDKKVELVMHRKLDSPALERNFSPSAPFPSSRPSGDEDRKVALLESENAALKRQLQEIQQRLQKLDIERSLFTSNVPQGVAGTDEYGQILSPDEISKPSGEHPIADFSEKSTQPHPRSVSRVSLNSAASNLPARPSSTALQDPKAVDENDGNVIQAEISSQPIQSLLGQTPQTKQPKGGSPRKQRILKAKRWQVDGEMGAF